MFIEKLWCCVCLCVSVSVSKKFCTCFLKWVTPICCFCVVTKTKWRFDNIEVWIVTTVSSVALRHVNIHITKKIEIQLDEFKLNDLDKQVFETKKTVETINKVRMLLHQEKQARIAKSWEAMEIIFNYGLVVCWYILFSNVIGHTIKII